MLCYEMFSVIAIICTVIVLFWDSLGNIFLAYRKLISMGWYGVLLLIVCVVRITTGLPFLWEQVIASAVGWWGLRQLGYLDGVF